MSKEPKCFRVGDLFDICPTKSYGLTNTKLFKTKGNVPVVVNSSLNNGIGGYVDLQPLEKGNIITYSDTTTSEGIFYQPNDFIGYSHVQGLYPKGESKWNRNSYLYFKTAFTVAVKGKYSYGAKFNRTKAAEEIVYLPITLDGSIDYEYMEERISELEEERISELEAYLKVTGLNDYILTAEEHKAIDMFNNGITNVKEYLLGGKTGLFEVKATKQKFNANKLTFGGKYPYVIRSNEKNGIRGYITKDEKFLNDGKTISFGQDTATMFYQEKPYFTGDKIKVFSLKNRVLNRYLGQYFITAMQKSFSTFSWGGSSFNEKILKNILISLPTKNNEPDFDFMETYIKATQKLVIKDVFNWKDEIIHQTKSVVSK